MGEEMKVIRTYDPEILKWRDFFALYLEKRDNLSEEERICVLHFLHHVQNPITILEEKKAEA